MADETPGGASLAATDSGLVQLLTNALGLTPAEPLLVRLFVNDHTPRKDDTAEFYEELDGYDYRPKRIDPADWRPMLRNRHLLFEGVAAVWVFGDPPLDASHTIFGYYVVGLNTNMLYWAERLQESITIQRNGERLRIIPRVEIRSRQAREEKGD